MDAVTAMNVNRSLEAVSVHLHGLLKHDVTEDELHEVLCGRLKLAVKVAWSSPTQKQLHIKARVMHTICSYNSKPTLDQHCCNSSYDGS